MRIIEFVGVGDKIINAEYDEIGKVWEVLDEILLIFLIVCQRKTIFSIKFYLLTLFNSLH